MKTVKTTWREIVEYRLEFMCPHCKDFLYETNFLFIEGDEIDEQFVCPLCGKKFKLKIEEAN